MYFVIGITPIVGNLITIIEILKFKFYKHSQYFYEFSIGVSEFLLGFFIIYYHVQHIRFIFSRFHTDQILTLNFERRNSKLSVLEIITFVNRSMLVETISFPGYTCIHVSSLTLAFSAYDRYKSIAHPFLYKRANNLKKSCIL